jgi:peroxiredoxin Q/BCP
MSRPAPDFDLVDQASKHHKLSDYKDGWLVVFFYPTDNSLNCTREACAFRDEQAIIGQFGNAKVVGINKNSVEKHKAFADKNRLNFPLLSDPTHEVIEAYGAWHSKEAYTIIDRFYPVRRSTYIINPKGQIVEELLGVKAQGHVENVIDSLQRLQNLVIT